MNKLMELTTRQWRTYNLIKENSLNGRKTNQYEIYAYTPAGVYKDGYVWNNNPTSHDKCPMIWSDIEKLNFSNKIEKVIVFKDFEYWIAKDEDDAKEFAKKYLADALKKLKRHWRIINKVKLDGQMKLLSTDGNAIDEKSNARDYVETYLLKELENDIGEENNGTAE
jgi:hypothetical protein